MSIDDQAGLTAENMADKMGPDETETVEPEVAPSGGFGFRLPSWFYIARLDEPVETYKEHPLNFGKSEGMAYVLRGFAALAGGILNYWWMDVIGGFLRIRKEAVAKAVDVSPARADV